MRTIIDVRVKWTRNVSLALACVYLAITLLVAAATIYTKAVPVMFEIDELTDGHRVLDVELEIQANGFLKRQFALIVLFWTALWALKLSILFLYKDLFHRQPKQQRYWKYLLVYLILSYLACWGTQLASCWPIAHYFMLGKVQKTAKGAELIKIGQCESKREVMASNNSPYVSSALDVFGDLMSQLGLPQSNFTSGSLTSISYESTIFSTLWTRAHQI